MKKLIIATILITAAFAACKTSKPTEKVVTKPAVDCGTMSVSYATDIKPILEQNCNRCHGRAGGYNFSEMADVKRSAQNGSLLGTIKWQSGFPKMPAGAGQLDAATIDKVECWIKNGMKD
jgi:hypothetical protein